MYFAKSSPKCRCKTASALKTDAEIIRDMCAAGASLGLGYDKEAANDEIVVATAKLAEVSEHMRCQEFTRALPI